MTRGKRGDTGAEGAPAPTIYSHTTGDEDGGPVLGLVVTPCLLRGKVAVRVAMNHRSGPIHASLHHHLTLDEARALRDVLDAIITNQKDTTT